MRSLLAVIAVVSSLSVLDCAMAQPAFPPPPAELGPMGPPPGPAPGFVVEPGHWQWNGDRYIWVRRHWIPVRAGYAHFVPGHWGRSGRWIPAHWAR